jgi:hypothetical protein
MKGDVKGDVVTLVTLLILPRSRGTLRVCHEDDSCMHPRGCRRQQTVCASVRHLLHHRLPKEITISEAAAEFHRDVSSLTAGAARLGARFPRGEAVRARLQQVLDSLRIPECNT